MELELELNPAKYKKFLINFRSIDIENAASEGETIVQYSEGGRHYKYFYKAPNFRLVAYNIGNGRVDLKTYNHIGLPLTKSIDGLKADLRNGGGGQDNMNSALSCIVAATSEAARSKVVEAIFKKMIRGICFNLQKYEILFKAYSQPAKFNGLLNQNGSYKKSWRALKKEDYLHFFNSSEYTGDSDDMRESLSGL